STSCFQRAPTSGAAAASRGVLVSGTPRPCYRSISIVADGRLEVCDGAHCAFVMKKVKGPARAACRCGPHGAIRAPLTLREKHAKDEAPSVSLCHRNAGPPAPR